MDGNGNRRAGADAPASSSGPGRPDRGPAFWQVTLWPNRTLGRRGTRILLLGSAFAYALPLLALAGSPALWVMAPILAFHVVLLWWFLRRNTRDGRLTETLSLWPDLVRVERREVSGASLVWEANPYWLRLTLHPEGKVENYLTLKGEGRAIELGAFLSPGERVSLKAEIEAALGRARGLSSPAGSS
jgi:uncharacterized membrane protein